MKRFIVYETATGKIRRTGVCPDDVFPHQAHGGEAILEGEVRNENFISDGAPIYIPPPPPTAEELAEKEERKFYQDAVGKLARALFNHENRIRVLEGKPEITWDQFKTAIRNLA